MKKSLFLILSILSIFFITDNVNALTFNFNGEETTVSTDNLINYIYYNHSDYFEEYTYFFLNYATSSTGKRYYYMFFSDYEFWYNTQSTTSETTLVIYPYESQPYKILTYDSNFNFVSDLDYTFDKSSKPSVGQARYTLASNFDIYNYYTSSNPKKGSKILVSKNITLEDLQAGGVKPIYTITYYLNNEIYKTLEVEEGTSHELLTYDYNKNTHVFSGWTYDETLDLTNITSDITINATLTEKDVIPVYIDFPITKTEFHTLLVEVGVLIMIIFLKWCFPFKGGSDLR